MDAISAVSRLSVHLGRPITDEALRRALPDVGGTDPTSRTGRTTFDLVARAAGLAHETVRLKPGKVRATHCPFVCRDAEGHWHAIVETAHAGLAVRALDGGACEPIRLADLAVDGRLHLASLRPADGPGLDAPDPVETIREGGTDEAKLLRSLRSAFWPSRAVIVPVVLATLAINVLALSIPLATMNIFDRVISNGAFETLWALAIGVALALLFDFALRSLRASVLDHGSARSDVLVANGVFGRILGARMSARRGPGVGSVGLQTNALREYESVREYFNASAMAALGDLPFVALFLLVIWSVAGSLVVVPLVAVPLFLLTALAIQMRLRRVVEGGFEQTALKNSVATETLAGIESIKLAGGEGHAAARWEQSVASQLRHSMRMRFWSNLSLHLITLFQGLTTISILVVGVYLVTAGSITPGALFATNLLAARCLGPLVAVSALVARLHQMRMAGQAVARLAAMAPERESGRRLVSPTPFSGEIVLDRVSFAYPEADGSPGRDILHDVSLTIRAGEHVAIIGGIGSGKSTLVRLVSMLEMPTGGRIMVDGIATTDLDPGGWRAQLGTLPQAPAFVTGTVRDNVALGRNLLDEEVAEALAVSGASAWLNGTGLGLDTPVGERGTGLSGGQLQTVAVARALAGRPPVVLLDEPTSHLDGRAEAAFAARLKAHTTTSLTVTHRPALIDTADRLIVMEAGRVLLDGPRATVLARLRNVVDEREAA